MQVSEVNYITYVTETAKNLQEYFFFFLFCEIPELSLKPEILETAKVTETQRENILLYFWTRK